MDYGKAFSYVFEDKEWIQKVLIGGLLMLASIVIFPAFFVGGYAIEVVQRGSKGDMTLPEWDNWADKFRKGISMFAIGFIYALPAIFIWLIIFIVSFAIGAFGSSGSGSAQSAAGGIAFLLFFVGFLIYFVYILFLMVIMPAIIIQYAITESIGAAFRFSEIYSIVKNHVTDVLIIVLFSFLAGIIAEVGFILLIVGVAFTGFYAQSMLMPNLYGQLAKKILEERG